MDLAAVRAAVAVADTGRFSDAADDLAITQQAVSKRVAGLERELGAALFVRTARGARLTAGGRAFLPHARELLLAADRAAASVRPGGRALRIDVIGRHLAPAVLLRDFHHAHPGFEFDVVTLFDLTAAAEAVRAGTIDASFRAVTGPLPVGVTAVRVYDEPLQVLTGPVHPLADPGALAELAGLRIWMPGIVTGTEWAAFYGELAAEFGLAIDPTGPNFGIDPLLEALAGAADTVTFVGERTQVARPGLRRIALRHPTPVYPHSLLHRVGDPHPALRALRAHLGSPEPVAGAWMPRWARSWTGGLCEWS